MDLHTPQVMLRSYMFMALAIFGWGLSSPFIEYGLQYIAPLPYLTYRFLSAMLIVSPFIIIYKRKEFSRLIRNKWTWIIGISESLGLIFQYLGQETGIPAGLAALISLMFLLIVPFLSLYFLKERLRAFHLIAVVIAFVGVVAITTEGNLSQFQGSFPLIGIILLILSAISYAMYLVSTSRLTTIEFKEVDIFTLFYTTLLIITVLSTASTFAFSDFTVVPTPAILWLSLLVAFSTLLAFFTYFKALQTIPANTASVLLPLQVMIPFAIEFFILGKTYSTWVLLGCLLIVVAMAIVVLVPYVMFKRSQPIQQATPIGSMD